MAKLSDIINDEEVSKTITCTFCGTAKPKRGSYWAAGGGDIVICLSCLEDRNVIKLIGQFIGDALKDGIDGRRYKRPSITVLVEKILTLIETGIYKAMAFDSIERAHMKSARKKTGKDDFRS